MFKLMIASGVVALTLAGCSASADDQPKFDAEVKANAQALMRAGLKDDVGLKFVEDLTTEIGQRLAGSQAEARARDWAVEELKALGFQNVRIEEFTIPYWSRVIDEARVTGDNPQNLVISALGGSQSTPEGGVEAPLVRFESMEELNAASPDEIEGKIVFIDQMMTATMDGSGYRVANTKRRECAGAAAEYGAVACLIRSVGTQHRRFPHTGAMKREGPLGALPAAALSPPDADQLARLLERGPVNVHVNIQVEAYENAPSGNVIAEVPGRTNPEETVLISCHLDSWDLGTGALDDGAGCGIVVGAAKLILEREKAPHRTIRVVLYGAEEVGLFGGTAYARRHAEDLPNHILAAESDFGARKIWSFQTRFGDGALDYARELQLLLQPLGVGAADNRAFGGPDIGVLMRAGVPVVTPRQNGIDYFDFHHTPDDTFDKIDPAEFRQNVAVYAGFAYAVADSGWDLRRTATDSLGTE